MTLEDGIAFLLGCVVLSVGAVVVERWGNGAPGSATDLTTVGISTRASAP